MVDLKRGDSGDTVALAAGSEAAELDDTAVLRLLAADDAESIESLAVWLKANSRTFAPLVMRAAEEGTGPSPEAAAAALDGLAWRAQADETAMLAVMEVCLRAVADRVTESLDTDRPGSLRDADDALVSSAVAVLTADRRSRHSETAIRCLSEAGTGGALILARAFDAVRGGLRLYIIKRLDPAEVTTLDDNVVASLADSVSKLAEELESPKRETATRFLAALGPVHEMECSEIGTSDTIAVGESVFHARWGAGTVLEANKETATIDFGSAGTRTLLRSLTTLRRTV